MASNLAVGYQFDNTNHSVKNEYKTKTVNVIRQLSVDKSQPHHRYLFETDQGVIKITAFELARVLFFHNRHLIKAAYSFNGLAELVFLDETVSPVKISFPNSTSYPVSNLSSQKALKHFAWLLLEPEARRSFFTINHCFRENLNEIGFNFSPPNLKGWALKIAIDNDDMSAVTEVKRIASILYAPTSKRFYGIEIAHPKRKFIVKPEGKPGPKKLGKTPHVDIDPELDLGAIPGFGKRRHIDRSSRFSFNVVGIDAVVFAEGQPTTGKSRVASTEAQVNPEKAGVGLPAKEGKAQEFEPVLNQNNDDFKDAAELPHRFLIFEEVVNELRNINGIRLESVRCGEFPKPTNGSTTILKTQDGKALRFFIATFELKGNYIILLEADTTSLNPPTGSGTLMLGLKPDASENFNQIIQHFANQGAQWQHRFIEERTIYFKSCSHPRTKNKVKTFSDEEYKELWLAKLSGLLKALLNEIV